MHAVVDDRGVAHKLMLTPGQVHDAPPASVLLEQIVLTHVHVLGDRGYDSAKIVELIDANGGVAVIPSRVNSKHVRDIDVSLYRKRNVIERFFNKIKRFRRIATRYDKLAPSFFAFVLFASSLVAINDF